MPEYAGKPKPDTITQKSVTPPENTNVHKLIHNECRESRLVGTSNQDSSVERSNENSNAGTVYPYPRLLYSVLANAARKRALMLPAQKQKASLKRVCGYSGIPKSTDRRNSFPGRE